MREPWYPTKRLTEGLGIFGRMVKEIDKREPLERSEKGEIRRIRPLANVRKIIYGKEEEEDDKKEADNFVKLKFDDLSTPIKKYANQQAKKSGKNLDEIVNSKSFKNYLLSQLKAKKSPSR